MFRNTSLENRNELSVWRLGIGERRLDRGDYCFWPAGSWHGPMRTEIGCEVLLMFDATPGFTEAATATPSERERLRIDALDTLAMPWASPPGVDGRTVDEAGSDLHVKFLREDPDTGAYTLYARQAPGWSEPKVEAHNCWEELILMEGDYLMATNGGVEEVVISSVPNSYPTGLRVPEQDRSGCPVVARPSTSNSRM